MKTLLLVVISCLTGAAATIAALQHRGALLSPVETMTSSIVSGPVQRELDAFAEPGSQALGIMQQTRAKSELAQAEKSDPTQDSSEVWNNSGAGQSGASTVSPAPSPTKRSFSYDRLNRDLRAVTEALDRLNAKLAATATKVNPPDANGEDD